MKSHGKTLFISDLHLDEAHPEIANIFFSLLKSSVGKVDALYILGDFFESWIGDDDETAFHLSVIHALKAATSSGLPIYFLHGNRDFLVGKKFFNATGCQFLPDETVIQLYGQSILLMHGDTLCTKDLAYLKSRKMLRNPILQTLFLLLPLSVRRRIANKIRQTSMQYIESASSDNMDATDEAVIAVLRKHQTQTLIHGHTHRPAIHALTVDGRPATRVVLAAWHTEGNMLVWDSGITAPELVHFSLNVSHPMSFAR